MLVMLDAYASSSLQIQCDALQTGAQCNWCTHHGLECTFGRVSSRSNKKRLMPAAGPQQHQRFQQRRLPSPCSSVSTPPLSLLSSPRPGSRRITNAVLGQIYFAGQNLAVFGPQNGIPQLTCQGQEWVYSRTGQHACFQSSNPHCPHGHTQPSTAASYPGPPPCGYRGPEVRLPESWAVQTMLAEYLDSDFSLVFPMVDGVLFQETIRLACKSEYPQSVEEQSAQACILAFLCLRSSNFPEFEPIAGINVDACASQAQALLFNHLQDASIVTLQTLIMMLLYETCCGRFRSASMYHSLACRATFVLGAHTLVLKPSDSSALSMQDREDRLLRMLFWLCYIFDKDIALRSGQPPIINDEYCDLTPPEGSDQCRFHAIVTGKDTGSPGDSLSTPWFPGDLRASLLKSKTCRLLYSASSLRMSDAELLRTIRELDEELESWRLSVPRHIAPSLAACKHKWLVPDADKHRSMLHIELHLNYYHIMNAIHTASGRCMVDGNGLGVTGIQSSLELSVEASRSTLTYLSVTTHRLLGEAFWVFVFYPMSALMTVFFNILRNPLDDAASRDVELLSSSYDVIRSMPISRITRLEKDYLQEVDAFIAELYRLGKCAISKSRAEQQVSKGDF
ncbi:hypothetical protein CDD82_4921 [Ophiocordyceps australis]|uniref:Xylanolytic transcriptional activator regulatory domain-containing protein n=1 Tax=Ophiocordyceps australis TaxID=1399860 RepID=A0A2C5ZRZ1_9HYPO|nr:hypothetical protein CDD82_4921 [Ophiocordyceps australis]